jgi:hypothetical protein
VTAVLVSGGLAFPPSLVYLSGTDIGS